MRPMMLMPDSDMPLLSSSEQSEEALVPISKAAALISLALKLRSTNHYALHPVEAVVQYHRDPAEIVGEESHGGIDFQQAEAHYRAGAQGLRLSEIPQLPQQLRELSRLASVDRAGRKSLRQWSEEQGHVIDEAAFFAAGMIKASVVVPSIRSIMTRLSDVGSMPPMPTCILSLESSLTTYMMKTWCGFPKPRDSP
jgi:hypothetical protein